MTKVDAFLTNCRIADGRLVDIGIADGKIAIVGEGAARALSNSVPALDAAHARWARRMPHPRQARQRLVEMHVAVDQPRQNQIAAHIECRRGVR